MLKGILGKSILFTSSSPKEDEDLFAAMKKTVDELHERSVALDAVLAQANLLDVINQLQARFANDMNKKSNCRRTNLKRSQIQLQRPWKIYSDT